MQSNWRLLKLTYVSSFLIWLQTIASLLAGLTESD